MQCPQKVKYREVHTGIIHNSQIVETTQLLTGEWISKLWCIYTMEYHTVIERNKLMVHTMTRMKPKTC